MGGAEQVAAPPITSRPPPTEGEGAEARGLRARLSLWCGFSLPGPAAVLWGEWLLRRGVGRFSRWCIAISPFKSGQVFGSNACGVCRANVLEDGERLFVVAASLLALTEIIRQTSQVVESGSLPGAVAHLAADGERLLEVATRRSSAATGSNGESFIGTARFLVLQNQDTRT